MSIVPRLRTALAAVVLAGALLPPTSSSQSSVLPPPPQPSPSRPDLARLHESFGPLPLSFEANQGQVDSQVQFHARGPGYTLFLSQGEAVLALRQEQRASERDARDERDASGKSAKGEISPGQVSGSRSQVPGSDQPLIPNTQHPVLRMKLVGANHEPRASGLAPQPGIVNYFIGNDPSKWHSNIPTYRKVQYKNVYPGIDLVYYGTNQRQLEYDFVVAPGADPKQIALTFDGADQVVVDENGDLTLTLPSPSKGEGLSKSPRPADGERVGVRGRSSEGEGAVATEPSVLHLNKPIVYQVVDGQRRELDGRYVLRKDFEFRNAKFEVSPETQHLTPNTQAPTPDTRPLTPDTQVSFAVASYDPAHPLIIDPVLEYATYLGGDGDDGSCCVRVDAAGNAFVAGTESSTDFPTTDVGNTGGGGYDAFVTKLNATGTALVYSTYFGGNLTEFSNGLSVDGNGNAYVTGETSSANFPADPSFPFSGVQDAFVVKLNPTGSALLYAVLLGGTGGMSSGRGIAVDGGGNAYVTGSTNSPNFLTTAGSYDRTFNGTVTPGNFDVFVTKLPPNPFAPVYSTYIGGDGRDQGRAIAIDNAGNAYITGATESSNFPTTVGAVDGTPDAFGDAFVTKLNPTGSALVYSTYLGSSNVDLGTGIAVDAGGNAYVTGYASNTFLTVPGSYDATHNGGFDGFVTKFNASGTTLLYSTYLGGNDGDFPSGIAVDDTGNAYVTGNTYSTNFPTTLGAFDGSPNGNGDGFVAKLDVTGSNLLYATYLGGSNYDAGVAISLDTAGHTYVAGGTASTNFPATVGSLDTTLNGTGDAFVGKLLPCSSAADLVLAQTVSPNPFDLALANRPPLVYTLSVSNQGPDPAANVIVTDFLPAGVTVSQMSPSQGSCTESAGTVTCTLGLLSAQSSATVTLTLSVSLPTDQHGARPNRVRVSAGECDPVPSNNKSDKLTVFTNGPGPFTLTILKQRFADNFDGSIPDAAVISINVPGIDGTITNLNGIDPSDLCSTGKVPTCLDDLATYPAGSVVSLYVTEIWRPGASRSWLFAGWVVSPTGAFDPAGNNCAPTGAEIDVDFNRVRVYASCSLVLTGPTTVTAKINGAQDLDFSGSFGRPPVPVGTTEERLFLKDMPLPTSGIPQQLTITAFPPFSVADETHAFSLSPGQETLGQDVKIRFSPTQACVSEGSLKFFWEGTGPDYPYFTLLRRFFATAQDFEGNCLSGGHRVTVHLAGNGSGVVKSDQQHPGITGPFDLIENYDDTIQSLTLTAIPDAGSVFSGWGGACHGTGACLVTLSGNKTIRATFRVLPVKKPPPPRTAPRR